MFDPEYDILDFPGTVKMLKFVYDKDKKDNIRALQFTIRVYFENLQREPGKNSNTSPSLQLVKK